MKIKDRIAVYFTLISTTMLLAVLCAVYIIFMKFLQKDFFDRLTDRTMVTANLYLEADEINKNALDEVRHRYLQRLTDEVIRVYDYKNQATFIGDSSQYWTKATIERVRKAKHLQYTEGNRQIVGIYYKDNQGDFVILASAVDEGSHRRLAKLLKIIVVVFVTISIILLLFSRYIAKKMLKPLNALTDEVKQIGSHNMAFRVADKNNHDEINSIAKSFNQLMDELEQAFTLQRSFVANASHELRTPLARIMFTAELALNRDRDKATYISSIESVSEDAEKMEHIITGLLSLAKMDLEFIQSQSSSIRIDEMLLSLQQQWKSQHGLTLKLTLSQHNQHPEVMASPTLLQIAINNVVSNAFKFSDNRVVTCELIEKEHEYEIVIGDSGVGIVPGTAQEIFNAFYSNATASGHRGNGMGLYMTQKIIHLSGGTIQLTQSTPEGCQFTIVLPKF